MRAAIAFGTFCALLLCVSIVLAGAGDVNGDGVVNVQDLLLVVQNIHAGTIGNADVNGDGVVNIFDLVDVARDFGKTYSTPSSGGAPSYSDGFESYALNTTLDATSATGFSWNGGSPNVVVSDQIARTGNKSLEFLYHGKPPGGDATAEQRFTFAPNASTAPSEVWMEWYVYFPKNFVYRTDGVALNNKLFNIWAETYSASPNFDMEYQGSTSSISPHVNIYTSGGPNSANFHFDTYQIWTNDASVAGAWHQIRLYMRLGNGNTDLGAIDVWFDGKLVVHLRTNELPFYDTAHNYFRNGYLMGWANTGFTNDTAFYIDDLKVYTSDPGWFAPPNITSSSPSGTLNAGTTNTTLSVTTNENATCKYSTTAGTAYSSMASTFSTTGGTVHSTSVSGLTDGNSYTYYVRCEDTSGNADTSDYGVSFSVASASASTSLYSDGFESDAVGSTVTGTGNQNFMWLGGDVSIHVSNLLAHSGSNSLRLEYNHFSTDPSTYSSNEQRFNFTPSKEVWFEYYIYFPSGNEGLGLNRYVQRDSPDGINNKLFTLWADSYSADPLVVYQTWSNGTTGNNFLNYGGTEADPTHPALVLYPDTSGTTITGTYGNHYMYVGDGVKRGQWTQMRFHLKVADYGQKNGEEEVWVNGKQVLQTLNLPLYDPTNTANYFAHGYLMGWANSGFNVNTSVFIDDFKLYTSNPGW